MHRDTTTTTNRKEKKRLENRVVVVVETLRRWDLEVKPLIEAKNRKEKEAEKIFKKWDLDFSVIGILTDSKNLTLKYDNETVCDIPISALADEAPKYEREWVEIKKPEHTDLEKKLDNINLDQTIKNLLS